MKSVSKLSLFWYKLCYYDFNWEQAVTTSHAPQIWCSIGCSVHTKTNQVLRFIHLPILEIPPTFQIPMNFPFMSYTNLLDSQHSLAWDSVNVRKRKASTHTLHITVFVEREGGRGDGDEGMHYLHLQQLFYIFLHFRPWQIEVRILLLLSKIGRIY